MSENEKETGQDREPSPSLEELKQRLLDQLAEYKKAELESLKLEKYKTGALWEIGNVAVLLKEAMGHGNWEPFVQQCVEEGWVSSDRTIQRAQKIRKNFERREDCAGLTVAEAEKFADQAEKIAKEGDTACQRVTNARKRKLADEVRRLRQENERLEAKLEGIQRQQVSQDSPEEEDDEETDRIDADDDSPLDEETAAVDPDEAAASTLIETLEEIVNGEEGLTPQEQEAFEAFVHALGDNVDRALAVVIAETKARLKKMYQ